MTMASSNRNGYSSDAIHDSTLLDTAVAATPSFQDQNITTKVNDDAIMICNPFVLKTWIRTGSSLCCLFGLALFVTYLVKDNADISTIVSTSSDNDIARNRTELYMDRYRAIYPIVTSNLSDWRDFINPTSPQSKALEWVIYKDTIIELTKIEDENVVGIDNEAKAYRYVVNTKNLLRLHQRYAAMVLFYSVSAEGLIQNGKNSMLVQASEYYHNHSECIFVGFSCNHSTIDVTISNSVTAIDLKGYKLAGTMPREIELLSSLTSLNLAENLLDGTLPSSVFENLFHLETLNLEQNAFSSTLPPSLGMLLQLKYFNVAYNRFSGVLPKELRNLNRLETLNLGYNPIFSEECIVSEVEGGVSVLDQIISNQPNLEHLVLDSTQLSGSIPQNMSWYNPKMVTFTINDTPIGGIFPSADFVKLSNLQYLVIANNNNIQGTFPDFSNLTKLEYVYIQGRGLSGSISENIGAVTGLKELHLIETGAYGSLPTQVGLITTLVTLEIFDNLMTGTLPTELGRLPNLEKFVLYDSEMTGTVPSEFCNNTKLSSIAISCSIPNPHCPTVCY